MALLVLSAKVHRLHQLSPRAVRGWLAARSVLTVGWLPINVAPLVVQRVLCPRGLYLKDALAMLHAQSRFTDRPVYRVPSPPDVFSDDDFEDP